MSEYCVPLTNPKPDYEQFLRILMGQEQSERPPLIEYIVDPVVMKPILTSGLGREWVQPAGDRASLDAYLDNFIAFWQHMGYDFVRMEISLPFAENVHVADDTAPAAESEGGKRGWRDLSHGTITDWESFEKYPWPKIEEMDFYPLEYINSHLPDGMGLISCHGGGIYEHVSSILSYETMCYLLADNPELVAAVTERVGKLMEAYYAHILQLDRLIVVFPGDDMGFKTGTLLSPNALKTYTLPWHKRFAEMTHATGRPYFLHSCGNLEAIMQHLIEEVKIDAKHSYEDAIIPVAEMQRRYGDKIAILGGIDVDMLTRATPEALRAYVRNTINECAPKGRYAVGSGNSIPSYIPLENYLTMIDEALR